MRRGARDAYFRRVESILAAEFGWGEWTREIFRSGLHADHGDGFGSWFEFICDDPVSARWRLKVDRANGPWALRMAYYGDNPEQQARADAITGRLAI